MRNELMRGSALSSTAARRLSSSPSASLTFRAFDLPSAWLQVGVRWPMQMGPEVVVQCHNVCSSCAATGTSGCEIPGRWSIWLLGLGSTDQLSGSKNQNPYTPKSLYPISASKTERGPSRHLAGGNTDHGVLSLHRAEQAAVGRPPSQGLPLPWGVQAASVPPGAPVALDYAHHPAAGGSAGAPTVLRGIPRCYLHGTSQH